MVAVAAIGIAAAVSSCGGNDHWDASETYGDKAVFTESDVEGGGITEAAAQELEACGFDTDEDARAGVVDSLGGGITAASEGVIAGQEGALRVRNTGTGVSPPGGSVASTVYEVDCRK